MDRLDEDPRTWLEELDGARAAAWVAERNARAAAALGGPDTAADHATALAILAAGDRVHETTLRAGSLDEVRTDTLHPRGLWRRCSLGAFRSADPDWNVLLDLDALCAAESESWVWRGCETLPPRHDRALVMLSRGGGDAVVVREFDLARRAFVADGFAVADGRTYAAWLDDDTILVSTSRGDDAATASGYGRRVKRWRRGETLAQAEVVFEGPPSDMMVWFDRDHRARRTLIKRHRAFWDCEFRLHADDGPSTVLDIPADATPRLSGNLLTIRLRSEWLGHRPGALLAISLQDFVAGGRRLVTLFEPYPRGTLENWLVFDDHVILHVLDDLRSRVLYAAAADEWRLRRVKGLSSTATVRLAALSPGGDTDGYAASIEDFLVPPSLAFGERDRAVEVVRSEEPRFDAEGLVASRHDAVAVDGTRIPYFQVGRPDARDAFTRMTGYGGFTVSSLPAYCPLIGRLWLERGHVYVLACVRGGGEFGPDWHRAGQREHRCAAQDDFAAVAADLVRRGVTTPKKLAAEGTSNGGLLAGNMLARHPERFGAILAHVPLLDMLRYTRLLAGPSWVAEYGDPDALTDRAFLRTVSPYHLLERGRVYPAALLTTSRRDDRVHPAHARKMAAALEEIGAAVLFVEEAEGGHGGGIDHRREAEAVARHLAFLRDALGMNDVADGRSQPGKVAGAIAA